MHNLLPSFLFNLENNWNPSKCNFYTNMRNCGNILLPTNQQILNSFGEFCHHEIVDRKYIIPIPQNYGI